MTTEEITVYDETEALPLGSGSGYQPGARRPRINKRSRPGDAGGEGKASEGGQAAGERVHRNSLRVSLVQKAEAQAAARRAGWERSLERQIAARITIKWVLEHVRINGEQITYEVLGYLIRQSRSYVEARLPSLQSGWSPWQPTASGVMQYHRLAFTGADAELLLMQLGLSRPICDDLRVVVSGDPLTIVTGVSGKDKIRRRARRHGFGTDPDDWRTDPSHPGNGKYQQ